MLMSPVHTSWDEMVDERVAMSRKVTQMLDLYSQPGMAPPKVEVDTSLDRIHFYIQYDGLNDRPLQELITSAYLVIMEGNINFTNPSLALPGYHYEAFPLSQLNTQRKVCTSKRARIGFISKFFGVFEPHGLLLDGVMRYLPRSHFEVIALPVARTDGW